MYLARGILNPASREVHRDLADAANLHRTIMRAFPNHAGEMPRQKFGVLHRVDEGRDRVLLVQSREKPEFRHVPAGYFVGIEMRMVGREREGIVAGDRFVFRLRANTTKKIMTKSLLDGTKQNGKRVPVRGDEARLQWLMSKGERGGFRVENVRVIEVPPMRGRARMRFAGALFDGVLDVVEPSAFRKALDEGIGHAKAFGFGLLSITRR